jgi:hypothetical protein
MFSFGIPGVWMLWEVSMVEGLVKEDLWQVGEHAYDVQGVKLVSASLPHQVNNENVRNIKAWRFRALSLITVCTAGLFHPTITGKGNRNRASLLSKLGIHF